jgi:hypothetical protein
MRLYVWENVLRDYTSGMIVALAPDMETALALACASMYGKAAASEMSETEPEVTSVGRVAAEPKIWLVHGGG